MRAVLIILHREWTCLAGSDRGLLAVQGLLVLLWSGVFASVDSPAAAGLLALWVLPFSVVVATSFTQTVFVSERVNGAVEVLLTCGLSREAILAGKVTFVAGLTCVLGWACLGLSTVWVGLRPDFGVASAPVVGWTEFALFAAASLYNAAAGALLPIWLPNPRMTHFISFLVIAVVLALYYTLRAVLPPAPANAALIGMLLLLAALAYALALVGCRGERMARQVSL